MTRTTLVKLREQLADESGANQLIVLAGVLGALLLIPVLFDFASVHYARRVSQTGVDAAVLAAAKEYAIPLTIEWAGTCGEPASDVVRRYLEHVTGIGWSGIGAGPAEAYALANRTRLIKYRNYFIGRSKVVDGVAIPFIEVYAETEKDISLLVRYGQDFDAPARATSNVYLDYHDRQEVDCGTGGRDVQFIYHFYWKIRLVY